MTDNKDLKYTKQFKEALVPKTYEQFILENKDLTQQDLYPDLDYEDISSKRGYGPCTWNNPNCRCSAEELRQQMRELQSRRTFNLRVYITNSSGRGLNGSGYGEYSFSSVEDARSFANRVKNTGWVVGGSGSITSTKRNAIANAIEYEINSYERGNSINNTLDYSRWSWS